MPYCMHKFNDCSLRANSNIIFNKFKTENPQKQIKKKKREIPKKFVLNDVIINSNKIFM